jgi:cell division protein FtsB
VKIHYAPSKRGILPRRTPDVKKRSPDVEQTSSLPRRRRGRILRYIVFGVGCVLIVDALVGDRGFLAMLKARQQYRTLEATLDRARAENADLREQARRLRDDPEAIKEIARGELGLVEPGEKVFFIKELKPSDSHKP